MDTNHEQEVLIKTAQNGYIIRSETEDGEDVRHVFTSWLDVVLFLEKTLKIDRSSLDCQTGEVGGKCCP